MISRSITFMMRFTFNPSRAAVFALPVIILLAGCDASSPNTLYDEDPEFESDPTISQIMPEDEALGGVGRIIITGENFSSERSDNLVFFKGTPAKVLAASTTRLEVRPPNVSGDNIALKVNVLGAENFAATSYTLKPPAEPYGGLIQGERPFAITTDDQGNLYASLFGSGGSQGIVKITSDSTRSPYVETGFSWNALELSSDGYLYGARNVRAVFRFPPGGGDRQNWFVGPDQSERLNAIEIDDAGVVWAGGNASHIYRLTPQGSEEPAASTSFEFEANVHALEVMNGFLYAAATEDSVSSIYRFSINSDGSLTDMERLLNVSAEYQAEALSLAATTEGQLFIGTDAADPLVLYNVGAGSSRVFYPGILHPSIISMAWGSGPTLFLSRAGSDIGGTTFPPNITLVNTQLNGAP